MSVIILSLPRCQAEVETCRDTPIPPRVPLTAGKPIYRPYSVPSPPASLDLPLPLSSVDGRSAGESSLEAEEGRVLLLERRVADMGCSCKIFRGNGPMSSSWEGCRREKSVQEQLQRPTLAILEHWNARVTLRHCKSRSLVHWFRRKSPPRRQVLPCPGVSTTAWRQLAVCSGESGSRLAPGCIQVQAVQPRIQYPTLERHTLPRGSSPSSPSSPQTPLIRDRVGLRPSVDRLARRRACPNCVAGFDECPRGPSIPDHSATCSSPAPGCSDGFAEAEAGGADRTWPVAYT